MEIIKNFDLPRAGIKIKLRRTIYVGLDKMTTFNNLITGDICIRILGTFV